jgi:hypothetical protein
MFISAGQMLIKAKSRVPNFLAFVRDHCNGLSRSRAYELIKIAGGNIEEVHANTNERKRRYRAKRASAATSAHVRSGTDMGSAIALAEFKVAVRALFPKMDEATRQAALTYAKEWADA